VRILPRHKPASAFPSTLKTDFLIVGQGLAGSVLALELLARQQNVLIINDPGIPAASAAAAGLFNPITGRRMSKTWQAEQLFSTLESYYPALEQRLGSRFFHAKPIYRPFASLEEQNTWIAETARPDVAHFAEISPQDETLRENVHNPYGGMVIRHAGYVDVKAFVQAARQHFLRLNILREEKFDYAQLQTTGGETRYGVLRFQKILFSEGPHATQNRFFQWLPFRPVKGEVLRVAIDAFPTEYIINQHLFVIPLPDGTHRAGATYDWRNLDWESSEAGKAQLTEKLAALVKKPFRVLDQWAGIRPATADRRPLLGIHPQYANVGVFGGMGSKGVSLVPFLAQHFTDFLLSGKQIMPEVNINRYLSLYSKVASDR
jgi:glycine/D-amino acid oxidase-like deaminating enzyme